MKRLLAIVFCLVALVVASLPVAAQTSHRPEKKRSVQISRYSSRYDNVNYDQRNRKEDYRYGRDRSIWDKHRDKITTAGAAVGGAVLGGLIGGRKGAFIGAIAGGAGAGIYAYKIRNKDRGY